MEINSFNRGNESFCCHKNQGMQYSLFRWEKKYIACKIKRKWKQKSDFQGCYIKFIVAFHLCLLSSVLWHESSPLSNDFQENIPKRNLNPVTFHVIWSCITYYILRTVTALKVSSNCLDYKRQVFYSSFLLAYRVDSFASLSDVAHILMKTKNEPESSLLLLKCRLCDDLSCRPDPSFYLC